MFGDFDSLAWDLGNPDGEVIDNPGPFTSLLLNPVTGQPMEPPITAAALRSMATDLGRPVTYTCVPPGSGERVGVDRDLDGAWDGDGRDAHTDPADPGSRP